MEGDKSAGVSVSVSSSAASNGAEDANHLTTANLVVHVLGGGFAGLACAAALRRMAHVPHVVVWEALPSERYFHRSDEAGAVTKVTPNGLRALAAIDPTLPHRVIAAGAKLNGVAVLAPDGHGVVRVLADDPEATTGWPQILIRWSVLRQ